MLVSPLRYPGGKAKLFEYFSQLIVQNELLGCKYCEPYAGGAGLALKLLSGGFVSEIFLNDFDEAIWAFWTAALTQNQEFCEMIASTELTIDEWHRQRNVWRAKNISNVLELGFATFFLNRTNRSGIIDGAGPVGGYAQLGEWKLDARFDRTKQAAAIRALAPYRSQIMVTNLDALDFVETTLSDENSLTYLDPPYYVKGSKLYRNSYNHEDHQAVHDAVSGKRDGQWVVSYDAVHQITGIYHDFDPIYYSLSYSAGQVASGKEVIFVSDALKSPALAGFMRMAA